jgi:sec-independent protein translocase protein TatA
MSPLIRHVVLAFNLGPTEVIIIGAVALLLFGRRLPEVAKSMGKSIVQFKKGLREVEDDIDAAASEPDEKSDEPPDTKTG